MITLGENIRALRLRDGRTQEAFGQALGVTAQAVSRWEKGICCPDMELIPSVANYFGVSIDELFGYDNERSRKVDALAARIDEMDRQNNGVDVNMDECIALARESLIEFPGNERLTLALAEALFNAGYVRHGEHHVLGPDGFSRYDTARHRTYPEWQEAVKLYEKLLAVEPNREKALAYVRGFDKAAWNEELRAYLGTAAESMIALEEKEGKYDPAAHALRLERIIAHWADIKAIASQELPTSEEMERLLDAIEAPKTLSDIGIDESELPRIFQCTKDIRDKYVLSRLAWDLGRLEELTMDN